MAVTAVVVAVVVAVVADAPCPRLYPTGVRCASVELRPQVRDPLHLAAPGHGTNFLRQVSSGYCDARGAAGAPLPLSPVADELEESEETKAARVIVW